MKRFGFTLLSLALLFSVPALACNEGHVKSEKDKSPQTQQATTSAPAPSTQGGK